MTSTFSDKESALWQRLVAHPFSSDDALDFTARLMREQGWTRTFAARAIDEYRRFCFLSVATGEALTPSEAVDEVWHLHLLYTRDYWLHFCPDVLGCDLHHGPTRGGRHEQARFHEQYAAAQAAYEHYFGLPPADLWPDARRRFADPARIRRVDMRRHVVLPRVPLRYTFASIAGVLVMSLWLLTPASAQTLNPLDWTAGPFLALYSVLAAVALVVGLGIRRLARDQGGASAAGLDAAHLAYLADGPDRCTDATIAQLLAEGKVVWNAATERLNVKGHIADHEPARSVMVCIASDGKPDTVIRRMQSRLAPIKDELIARKLWLDADADWRARWTSSLPLFLVLLLGVAKIIVGLGRDKPVGFLLILSVIVAISALVLLGKKPKRSIEGDLALKKATREHHRICQAPRTSELGLAVALAGTAVLSTTAYANYHSVRQPPSGGDSGGGGGSDSSSDGGGGGCGGCGGGGGD
jgi:uncharacterized protein (TIGR04222 family)